MAIVLQARRGGSGTRRKGAVTVEMAVVCPLMVTIVMGIVETSRVFELQNLMALAGREGARLAAMDREGLTLEGQSTNDKITDDIKNYLHAVGFDKEKINVLITHANSTTAFDLDAAANEFELFRVRVEIPYTDTCETPLPGFENLVLAAGITFRNGRVSSSN